MYSTLCVSVGGGLGAGGGGADLRCIQSVPSKNT